MTRPLILLGCLLALAACQSTSPATATSGTSPDTGLGDYDTALTAAVTACAAYVETGSFDADTLARAGLARTGLGIYQTVLQRGTFANPNGSRLSVKPLRQPGCNIILTAAGGSLVDAANAINTLLNDAGWRFTPQDGERIYTKGTTTLRLTGYRYDISKTFTLK